MEKPFSKYCENNKQPILEVIAQYFTDDGVVLEIGSGTGQHAMYFAEKLPHIYWQTSERSDHIEGVNQWLNAYRKYNLGRPFEIDVKQDKWPIDKVKGIFSANTSHIMRWQSVEKMFQHSGELLLPSHYFCLYGPVNINGEYTSDSNKQFDQFLRSDNPKMGLRNLEDLQELAKTNGLEFVQKHDMPANNFIMVWQKPE